MTNIDKRPGEAEIKVHKSLIKKFPYKKNPYTRLWCQNDIVFINVSLRNSDLKGHACVRVWGETLEFMEQALGRSGPTTCWETHLEEDEIYRGMCCHCSTSGHITFCIATIHRS